MARPSSESMATPSTTSPSESSCARSRSSPFTRAAMISAEPSASRSRNSSQAFVPVVTDCSARCAALTTVTLTSDTTCSFAARRPGRRVRQGGSLDGIQRRDAWSLQFRVLGTPGVDSDAALDLPAVGAGLGDLLDLLAAIHPHAVDMVDEREPLTGEDRLDLVRPDIQDP